MLAVGSQRKWNAENFVATAFFWPFFSCVLVLFDVLQRGALRMGISAHERVVVALNRSIVLILRAVGTEICVHGELPSSGAPLVILSNHQSLFDVPLLHTVFAAHRPRYIAKSELGKWIPSISLNLRRGLNALINRSNRRQSAGEIRRLGMDMRRLGFATVLFPEGTRSREGELLPFRALGLASLLEACPGARILPVTIDGSWQLARFGLFPIVAGRRLHVAIGPLLPEHDSVRHHLESSEAIISETLRRLRGNCELAVVA